MARYEKGNNKFVNPYAFVSLSITPPERKKREKGSFYGWIECSLENLTPLFIPNTSNDDILEKRDNDGEEIKSYDFFSYSDLSNETNNNVHEPVIPGSELRGMIRQSYETVTNSCMSSIDDEMILYQRLPIVNKPGRIWFDKQDNTWKLTECERYAIRSNECNNLKENQKVNLNITNNRFKYARISNHSTNTKGYFHKGEYFFRKHHESVFVEKNNIHNITEDDVESVLDNIKVYREEHPQREHRHKQYKHLSTKMNEVKEKGMLVYYNKVGGKYYLSPAAIGRYVFHNNLKDIIKDFHPCHKKDNLCPTCSLFGTIASEGDENIAYSSRLRFTDAKFEGDFTNAFENFIVLKELASPKLSAVEFYLQKPREADIWNYDFYIKWPPKGSHENPKLKLYQPVINGRKFYWHHKNFNINNVGEKNPTKRNVVVRPLKPKNKFKFKVYFDGITELELKKLLWVLEIGKKENNAHKLGFAKPLGFGSVKIKLENITVRELKEENNKITYNLEQFNQDADESIFPDKNVVKEYLKITDYSNAPTNVQYPKNEEDNSKTFEWFVANRSINTSQMKPKIHQILKSLLDNDPGLKKYKRR